MPYFSQAFWPLLPQFTMDIFTILLHLMWTIIFSKLTQAMPATWENTIHTDTLFSIQLCILSPLIQHCHDLLLTYFPDSMLDLCLTGDILGLLWDKRYYTPKELQGKLSV